MATLTKKTILSKRTIVTKEPKVKKKKLKGNPVKNVKTVAT